jgi:4-amino-4-deoxy-L-arabinose transferase-like glycosyltransferase
MSSTTTSPASAAARRVPAAERAWTASAGPFAVFGVALAVRLWLLAGPPHIDELYTVLAAEGWLAEGVPRIADGLYPRAWLYTAFVASWFEWFGSGIVSARVPSALAGSLLVPLVFVWTRAVGGSAAAWIAALFVALSPLCIQVSQFARFYALHALLFWLAAIAVYFAVEPRRPMRLRLAAAPLAIALTAISIHLQPLTLIGLAGVGLWLAGVAAVPWLWSRRHERAWFLALLGMTVALCGALLGTAWGTGLLASVVEEYRGVPLHLADRQSEVWYYSEILAAHYPSLWALFPLAALLAVARRPRPAAFCCMIFVTAFVLLSLAGMKTERYLTFALPFLFVIWGIALAAAWPWLRLGVSAVSDRAARLLAPGLPRRPMRIALLALTVVFLLVVHKATATLLLTPFGRRVPDPAPKYDWTEARALLAPELERASVVLTGWELHTLYYLGRFDTTLSASRLSEIPDSSEFGIDPRTGRPVISRADSVALLMECFPDGLVVVNPEYWRAAEELNDEMAGVIEARATPIELPAGLGILAFRWQTPIADPPPAACARVPGYEADKIKH